MNVEYIFLIALFTTLLAFTKEVPIVGSTFPPEPPALVEHEHGSHVITAVDKSNNEKYGISDEERGYVDLSADRRNHSRMLTLSTTLGYEEWWFLTTRRPQLYLKDFPGRPGVASWKEISPVSSEENRKSQKAIGPTAAGVSSGSQSFTSKYHYSEVTWRVFSMLFLSFCLCWT